MQYKILFLTPNTDGITSDSQLCVDPSSVYIVKSDFPGPQQEEFIKRKIIDINPDIVVITTCYGAFIHVISSIVRKTLPDIIIILCGAYLLECIFPIIKLENVGIENINYIVQNKIEIPFNQFIASINSVVPQITNGKMSQNISGPKSISMNIGSTEPLPEIKHLSLSLRDSINQTILNRHINEQIKNQYFKDRFVLVAAIPKSASSVIASCIAIIHSKGFNTRGYARYMLANEDSDLRPEIVRDFPQGGVLKYHTSATSKNLKVLHLLDIRYFILLRNPIDQLAAIYCHTLNNIPKNNGPIAENALQYDHIFPLSQKMFMPEVKMNDSIGYLIREGYLTHSLSWMVDWLRFRDSAKSLVVRYEDFMTLRNKTLNLISSFFHDTDVNKDIILKCDSVADGFSKLRSSEISSGSKKYPHGWTGKIGTWESYFTEENKNDYLSVVNKFLNYYPNASLILDIYPNLLDL